MPLCHPPGRPELNSWFLAVADFGEWTSGWWELSFCQCVSLIHNNKKEIEKKKPWDCWHLIYFCVLQILSNQSTLGLLALESQVVTNAGCLPCPAQWNHHLHFNKIPRWSGASWTLNAAISVFEWECYFNLFVFRNFFLWLLECNKCSLWQTGIYKGTWKEIEVTYNLNIMTSCLV